MLWFVHGCDGSIMLDNDAENGMVNENDAPPNQAIEFDIVNDINTALEAAQEFFHVLIF